jgi:hypothetical protein
MIIALKRLSIYLSLLAENQTLYFSNRKKVYQPWRYGVSLDNLCRFNNIILEYILVLIFKDTELLKKY